MPKQTYELATVDPRNPGNFLQSENHRASLHEDAAKTCHIHNEKNKAAASARDHVMSLLTGI